MSSLPAPPTSSVDKPTSILLLSPSLELARAFLLRLFQHCALPPPADLPSLGWAGQARWSISNRYYDAEVAFVLRQVLDEDGSAALASDESEAQEEEDEDEEDAEDGYPAVLVLLSTAALAQTSTSYRVPGQVPQALAEEKPDVSLAFSLAEGDASSAVTEPAVNEEREEALVEAFLELGVEYISSASAALPEDNDHTPPPYEQLVQSLSSHMWPSLALKSKSAGSNVNGDTNGSASRSSAHDTISALAGLLGGMGGFGLAAGAEAASDDEAAGQVAGSDGFSDDNDDEPPPDEGYAQLNGADGDEADFGEFASADVDVSSLDGEHRQAGLEFMSALASSSAEAEQPSGSPTADERAGWTTFDTPSTLAPPVPAPARSDSLLESFGPSTPALTPSAAAIESAPDRKFSSSFAPPASTPAVAAAAVPPPRAAQEADPTADLGAMLSHLNSLRSELAGVDDDDERRRRAADAVMALFGDDFEGAEEGDEIP